MLLDTGMRNAELCGLKFTDIRDTHICILGKWKKLRQQIRISSHACRYYYAQTQLKNGCDLFTVSKLLGHSIINITKRYLKFMSNDDVLEIAVRASPLLNTAYVQLPCQAGCPMSC